MFVFPRCQAAVQLDESAFHGSEGNIARMANDGRRYRILETPAAPIEPKPAGGDFDLMGLPAP